jgi:hypothetical protein
MATYYKYAERTADSQINWAEIGKNMTDMLQQEVAIREEKKAALDEVTRKAAEQISNAPQGQHESGRAEAIRLADQASKYLLMQDRLMKQGLLDPKDYMISRQNLTDGVKQAYTSIKAFQDNYARLLENAQKDKSSAISIARLEKIQGYGNFNQSGFFIDAPTGKLNVGLKEEQIVDGKKVIGLKKGSTVGMQYIDGAIYGEIDKFKYMDPLKQMADGVGEFVTATITPGTLSSIGYVTTVSDARKRIDAMNIGQDEKKILYDFYASSYDTINSILANENHKASLLVDAMASKGYFWTDDPDVAAKDPKAVLEVIDPGTGRGVMKFSKEQDQAAADFMMQQFLGMIDVKETKASTGQIQLQERRPETEAQRGDRENANVVSNVAKLYYGTDAEVEEASDFLRSLNSNIDTINRSGSNITITYKDGRPPEIRRWQSETGDMLGQESWVTANANFFMPEDRKMANVNEIVRRAGIDKNRTFNPKSEGFSASTTQEKEDVTDAFKRIAQDKSGLKASLFEENESKTVKNLTNVISSIPGLAGSKLEEAEPGSDVVILKDKNDEVIARFDLKGIDETIGQSYVNRLLELAANRNTLDERIQYVGKGRKVSEPTQRTSGRNPIPR